MFKLVLGNLHIFERIISSSFFKSENKNDLVFFSISETLVNFQVINKNKTTNFQAS